MNPSLTITAAYLFLAIIFGVASPCAAQEPAKPAPKITYDQHIKPIFREHCLKCHNGNEQKGGLALHTFGATMEGGASGEVVYAEELDSSRLWALVNHDEKPAMPPNGDRIADTKLATIKNWIEQGALENSGSKKSIAKKPDWSFKPVASDSGPGAMPENWLRQPVTTTSRAAQIAGLACSPRAPLVAVSGHRQVSLYHTETSELLGIAPFPEGMPYVVRFSRDGSLLMVGGGRAAHSGYVALYDVKTGQRVARVGDELDAVMTADIDASLQSIVIGDTSKLVKVFDIVTGETRLEIKKHTDWVTAVGFSPDGKWLATADRAGGLILWEAATGREHMVFDGHAKAITAISWRGDSKVFATSSENANARVWSIDNRKAIKNWGAHGGGTTWIEFAPNGDLLTTGRDQVAKLWDGNGKGKLTFKKMSDIALRVSVSSDGKRVFVGDWAGNLKSSNIDKPDHVGVLLSNPPTLDVQLAVARQKLAERKKAAAIALEKKTAADTQVVNATKLRDEAVAQLAALQQKTQELESQADDLRKQLQELDDQLGKRKSSIGPAKVAVTNSENSMKSVTESLAQVVAASTQETAAETAQRKICEQLEASQRAFTERASQLKSAVSAAEKRLQQLPTDSEPQEKAAAEQAIAIAQANLEFFQQSYSPQ